MGKAYDDKVKSFLLNSFLNDLDVWAYTVCKALDFTVVTADTSYALILKRNLKPCIDEFDVIILDAYEHLQALAEKEGLDVERTKLIPIQVWMQVEPKIDAKLKDLSIKIKSVLKQHARVIKDAPEPVRKIVKDLNDILKVRPKEIYDILNTKVKE